LYVLDYVRLDQGGIMYDAQIQDADIHMPHKLDRDYPIRSSLKQARKI